MKIAAPALLSLLLSLGTTISATQAAPNERIDIKVDRVVRPVTYAGSGFLVGAFSMDQPKDDLFLPLKVQRVRATEKYLATVYKKCQKLGISMEVICTNKPYWQALNLDGSEEDYKKIEKHFEELVGRMLDRGLKGLDYSVFLDADAIYMNWTEERDALYLEAYRRAYMVIKRVDPQAGIVGPGSHWAPRALWWKDHKGDHTWFIRHFIDFCIANKCVPDMISWHDYSMDGMGITRDAKAVRKYLKKRGLPDLPLEQDDMGAKNSVFRPGIFVSYLANVERAGIKYTIKCCWDGDCRGNTLQGMLTKETRKPRSLWWMYKAYGELTGNIVDVKGSKTVDAVAAFDEKGKKLRAVIGRYKKSETPVVVRLSGLNKHARSVKILAERIQNTEADPLDCPEQTISKQLPVSNGVVEIALDDLGPFDVYSMTVTLPQ